MKTEKIVQRYFNALKDLHSLLKCTDHFKANKFEREHNLPHSFVYLASKHGLIERTGTKKKYKYKWNTIDPTLEMAAKLRLKVNQYNYKMADLRKAKKQNQTKIEYQSTVTQEPEKRYKRYNANDVPAYIEEHNQKPKKKELKIQSIQLNHDFVTKSFSILWGLFKFERRIEK